MRVLEVIDQQPADLYPALAVAESFPVDAHDAALLEAPGILTNWLVATAVARSERVEWHRQRIESALAAGGVSIHATVHIGDSATAKAKLAVRGNALTLQAEHGGEQTQLHFLREARGQPYGLSVLTHTVQHPDYSSFEATTIENILRGPLSREALNDGQIQGALKATNVLRNILATDRVRLVESEYTIYKS